MIRLCCSFLLVALVLDSIAPCNAQETMTQINPAMQAPMPIDLQKVSGNGLRIIKGKHVTIYTDVPPAAWVEELPTIFDAAVPQWCDYFAENLARTKPWRISAFLIRDKQRFRSAGLIPDDLPEFPAGLNRGHEIWFMLQPDRYYTRHLLLHEGTHAFMQWFGNGIGAPWYAEGMAELLGLHQWSDGKLKLNFRVSDPRDAAGWGRARIIKDWNRENAKLDSPKIKSLQDVLLTPNGAFAEVENYAWCWAACEFLSQHPLASKQFGKLQKVVHQRPEGFNKAFLKMFAADMNRLEADWAWFIREMDYGYCVSSAAITELRPTGGVAGAGEFELQSNRGWQMIRTAVKKGQRYKIKASGRFEIGSSQINARIKPWPCEANGITIEYFRGRPLGELHATILPDDADSQTMAFIYSQSAMVVGTEKVIAADKNGFLCFRINESPANLADNAGALKIAIEKLD